MRDKVIKHKYEKNNIILVFANYSYLPVLENWLAAVKKIDVDNYLVISLDEKLYQYLQEKKIATLLRPCDMDLGQLWIHRIEIILELLEEGYNIIHSDADAIWLKDPQPYLEKLSHDMIFSQGTIWPPDVQEKWGFVLCCGFFYLRSNPQAVKFVRKLSGRVRKDKDDQISCNRVLLESGIVWDEPFQRYKIDFRNREFVCSHHVRSGKSNDMSIALLPHAQFQRIFEKENDVYIRHIISEKNSDDIINVLEDSGCKFI